MDSNDSQQETAYLELIKLYYRQVLEALQGFCVALIFCFLNKEVTSEIKRFYKQSQLRSTVMDTTPQSRSKSRSWLLKGNLPISVIRRSKWNDFWKMTRWRRQRHTSFVRPSGPRKPSSLCQQTNSRRSDVKREIVIGTI
ncbi:hypothetical protein P879_11364 [Paragonimus westermani]|uniref:G-protein coupled receptors family 2 profile 2 domain-containing protein n=1 Tax=Paragonimus westermani TaxID=34504 RepID=A0A8T0DB47_9TREM|nr:hypothetical protein P879_11364 [Paragonimus westermani]